MDFTNNTAAPATFLKTTFGKDHIQAAVIARPTFRVEGGQLVPTPDFVWPEREPKSPEDAMPPDVPFLTGGIDFIVKGSVWQPNALPGLELTAEIRIGQRYLRRITAIGNRHWVRRQDGWLMPSYPEPFVSMPLSYENAFGGQAETEQGACAWPANPSGKGFYLTPERAEGQPLPNLEDPDHRIATIEDRPEPIATGPYPEGASLRVENAVEVDLESDNPGLKRITPLVFNRAHPRMILAPANTPQPGELIEITHASPHGPLQFPMPELTFHVQVRLEDRSYHFPLHLDLIAVLLDEQRVVLGYRVVFKYRLVRRERRSVALYAGPVPEATSA